MPKISTIYYKEYPFNRSPAVWKWAAKGWLWAGIGGFVLAIVLGLSDVGKDFAHEADKAQSRKDGAGVSSTTTRCPDTTKLKPGEEWRRVRVEK